MPLITRRSSTRGFPPPSVGSSGSIFAHCSSVSQNRLRLTVPSHMVGGQRIAVKLIRQQDYWVFTLGVINTASGMDGGFIGAEHNSSTDEKQSKGLQMSATRGGRRPGAGR